MKQFYSYLWLREDGTPYYVGKGVGNRAFVPHRMRHALRPPRNKNRILILSRSSEREAFETEKELIANWGRLDIGTGCLRNMTDGGENPPSQRGKSPSKQTRQKLSRALKGVAKSPVMRVNLSRARLGVRMSDAARQKAKLRVGPKNNRFGVKLSLETIQKMSAARYAYWARRHQCL